MAWVSGYQQMAPGQHRLNLRTWGRTLFRKIYWEEWYCPGCGIIIDIRGRDVEVLSDAVDTFRDEHSGYLSAYAVLNRARSLVGRCKKTEPKGSLKVRIDLTDWQTIKLNRGNRVLK